MSDFVETLTELNLVSILIFFIYAVMARSVGLEVKVVTGVGYDGRGGYGPHAWNEVYLSDRQQWVPLDTTWVSSGQNWFDPKDFDKTHVRDT